MISLPLLLTKARRFVDGVCAIPRFASMERLDEMREASRKATQIRSELGIDETGLLAQLATEREAHASQQRLAISLQEQLSAARADLEALTVWNLQSEKPCPVDPDTDVSMRTARYGICLDKVSTMIATDSWRHTPESLAAWKAREGGDK